MVLRIELQDRYSRLELLLRTLFGWLYILAPHVILLAIFGLWSAILSFIAFWVILFTGRYPESMFEYQVSIQFWAMRLNASLYNLVDGYPALMPGGQSDVVAVDIPYPEHLGRGHLLLKILFGQIYCVLPHSVVLYFRLIVTTVLMFLAWWVVLFAGTYPVSWHAFNVGTLRWSLRLGLYMNNMTDEYPPFSGQ